jgi:hypothetical protein
VASGSFAVLIFGAGGLFVEKGPDIDAIRRWHQLLPWASLGFLGLPWASLGLLVPVVRLLQ